MENKYWSKIDIRKIYKNQDDNPYSLDSLALSASWWGSGRMQNYSPRQNFIPTDVKYTNGKFYAYINNGGTGKDKWEWVEVPFDYSVLPKYIEMHNEINETKTNKNMEKNVIKLNENTLRKIVAESVKNIIKEYDIFGRGMKDYEVEQCVNELKPLILKLSQSYTTEQIEAALEKILKLGV